eukprot:3131779-Rhodomonas_salina.1
MRFIRTFKRVSDLQTRVHTNRSQVNRRAKKNGQHRRCKSARKGWWNQRAHEGALTCRGGGYWLGRYYPPGSGGTPMF